MHKYVLHILNHSLQNNDARLCVCVCVCVCMYVADRERERDKESEHTQEIGYIPDSGRATCRNCVQNSRAEINENTYVIPFQQMSPDQALPWPSQIEGKENITATKAAVNINGCSFNSTGVVCPSLTAQTGCI